MNTNFTLLAVAKHKKNTVNNFLFILMGMLIVFTLNASARTGCSLSNGNGYYGGFEALKTNGINNLGTGAASTYYAYGSGKTQYQILSYTDRQSGYLALLPHSGQYFLTSLASSSNPNSKLWYKDLTVYSGQKFQICAWIANLKVDPVLGFPVSIVINTINPITTEVSTTVIATKSAVTNTWVQIGGFYTVPAGITSIQVEIKDPSPTYGFYSNSNHFLALDDNNTPRTNPDFNTTFVDLAVSGNVSTNDVVPEGTTYRTAPVLLSSPTGSVAALNMNNNGTYSFTANTAGVYTYDVQVCGEEQTPPCPVSRLVITVLNATIITNAPIANVDIATTNFNTAVTLRTLANDAAGNANIILVPSTVFITSPPKNGTTSVNSVTGDITYKPNSGFTGMDTLTYKVCDNQVPAKCATALEIITVKPSESTLNTTTAADDYKISPYNTLAIGNVKTNDTDAEGNTQTVTAQTTTIGGKGTLVLIADGSYTFTPVTGFTGPVDFPYTTCDNGTPQAACASATLHILVFPAVIGGGPTPVSLIDFTASKQNKSVDLNWQTANEQNSNYFDVEFSRDGGKFESIGRVKASGSSTTLKSYSLKHLYPVNGVNYYRLKMVDVDASSKYSAVRTVKFSTSTSIAVMPNPTADRVYITSNEGGMLQSVGLYTISGKLLQQLNNFTLGKSIDLSTYSPSIYILKLIDKNGSTEVIKVVRK